MPTHHRVEHQLVWGAWGSQQHPILRWAGDGWIEYWGQVCNTLQMQTDVGYLRATFQETSTGHAETTAAFGVISGCN